MKLTDENQDYQDSRPIDLTKEARLTPALEEILRKLKEKRANSEKSPTDTPSGEIAES